MAWIWELRNFSKVYTYVHNSTCDTVKRKTPPEIKVKEAAVSVCTDSFHFRRLSKWEQLQVDQYDVTDAAVWHKRSQSEHYGADFTSLSPTRCISLHVLI